MVERSDTTGHRCPSPSAPGRGASPVPPAALASLPGCGGSRSHGSPVVSSLRSSTTGYTLGSLRLHGRWTPRSLGMWPPAPMPRSPIRYPRVVARRLPPLTGLGIESFRPPYAWIWEFAAACISESVHEAAWKFITPRSGPRQAMVDGASEIRPGGQPAASSVACGPWIPAGARSGRKEWAAGECCMHLWRVLARSESTRTQL